MAAPTITESERSGTTPYVTLMEVAAGGMGRVELALRIEGEFRRLYAVKRLHPHLREDPEFQEMFVQEARVAGLVRHPNVVSVLDVGVDDRGPFLAMDFIEGVSLSRLVSLLVGREEPMPLQVALRIAIDTARGLHAIHEARTHDGAMLHLIHRDLSPQNILVAYAGVASITDFGIAKAVGQSQRTSTGVLKGKVSYMSPEQLRFESIDRRADLFAFGVVLFEMIAGRRLYPSARDANAPNKILHEPAPDLGDERPETPAALVELMFELLAKQADERPPTAAVVARRLERVLAELVVREPAIELGPYVESITQEVRDEQQAAIRAATERAMRGEIVAPRTGVAIDVEVQPVVEAATRVTATPRARGMWIAALALAVFIAIATTAFEWSGRREPVASAPPAPTTTVVIEAPPPPPSVAPPPETTAETTPVAAEPVRRTRRTRSAPSTSAPSRGVLPERVEWE